MKYRLKIWRQEHRDASGKMVDYEVDGITPEMSLLTTLDRLNEQLVVAGERAVAFDHDCREGICGQCGLYLNGVAHGPGTATTTCQVHMRSFREGSTLYIEPWRASAFPIICDLVVDRGAFDRIIQAGGYVSVNAGTAPEANSIPIRKEMADRSFDAATCIGCGACVAACKNASAMLFTAAKVSHLSFLPHGRTEATDRALSMVARMDDEGFGNCTNTGACEAVCPKEVSIEHIGRLNWEFVKAQLVRGA